MPAVHRDRQGQKVTRDLKVPRVRGGNQGHLVGDSTEHTRQRLLWLSPSSWRPGRLVPTVTTRYNNYITCSVHSIVSRLVHTALVQGSLPELQGNKITLTYRGSPLQVVWSVQAITSKEIIYNYIEVYNGHCIVASCFIEKFTPSHDKNVSLCIDNNVRYLEYVSTLFSIFIECCIQHVMKNHFLKFLLSFFIKRIS